MAADIAKEGECSIGRVAVAGGVTSERLIARGRVASAGRVAKERLRSDCCIEDAVYVENERLCADGNVAEASGVAKERHHAVRRVGDGPVVVEEGESACGGVEIARSFGMQRRKAIAGIPRACGQARENSNAIGCVTEGQRTVRVRGSRIWHKPTADQRQRDEKWQNCCFKQNQWIHGSSFLFPAELILRIAGPEGAKNLAGKCLRLIRIRLTASSLEKTR